MSQTFFGVCVFFKTILGLKTRAIQHWFAFLLNSIIFFPQFVVLAIGLCCLQATNGIYVFKIQSKLAASNQLGAGNLLQVEQNGSGTPTVLSTNGSSADKRYTRK